MIIAIDLDDCLADLISKLIVFHNESYKTFYKKDDFFSYHYEEVWGGTKTEAIRKVREFIETNHFKSITPKFGSQKAMQVLKDSGHNLSVVTGRENFLKDHTFTFIENNYPNIFSGIYHANSYSTDQVKIKKSTICKELGANVIIDDDLMHIMDCAEAGIKVLVFNSPWNQGELPMGAIRVFDWEQIVSVINELGKGNL